jgi:hypothetical protein
MDMYRLVIPGLVACVTLIGCSAEDADQMARRTAKSAVNQVVAQNFPGVNAAPYTDCIVDNATADEVLNLATGVLTGPDASTTEIVLNIAARPATAQCIALGALNAPLG